ncbi:MAG: hypothetical protein IPK26_28025 [Planctomycetes bacterium]|nr:hypothetical protein [Planctomycetota bacterium]
MIATRAGWLDKVEITEVWFDPKRLPFAALLAQGQRTDCAQSVWTTTATQLETARQVLGDKATPLATEPKPDREAKYYLLQSPLRALPMTATQATRCNAELAPGRNGSPERWLSPRQLELLAKLRREPKKPWPLAIDVPLPRAWAALPR